MPAFQEFGSPVMVPGITGSIPPPSQAARTFQGVGPVEQQQLLDLYFAAGIPNMQALDMIFNATPGFRRYPRPTFTFGGGR